MTQSVFYSGTGPSSILASDGPDSAGKVYYRLTIQHDTSIESDLLTFGFGWTYGLVAVYTALQSSGLVIPISAQPINDGTSVAIINVVVAPTAAGATVADLVNLVNEQTHAVALFKLEKINPQGESESDQATDRNKAASNAAAATSADSWSAKLKALWSSLEGDLKWIVVGIIALVLGYVWYTARRK